MHDKEKDALLNNDEIGNERYSSTVEDVIENETFIGKYSLAVIIEEIAKQFNDYIDIEDTKNYVDIFYTQLNASMYAIKADQFEEHPEEKTEILYKIEMEFIQTLVKLIQDRFTITIMEYESGSYDRLEIKFCIETIYDYFIIHGKENICDNIRMSMLNKLLSKPVMKDSDSIFNEIDLLKSEYDPLIIAIKPDEFIKNNEDMVNMYESDMACGNFLRKLSAKFYKNEDFWVHVVDDVFTSYSSAIQDNMIGESKC